MTIADIIAKIRSAVIGIEVRDSIADGIEAINVKVDGTVLAAAQAGRKIGTNGQMTEVSGTSFVEIPFNESLITTNSAVFYENSENQLFANQTGYYLIETSVASSGNSFSSQIQIVDSSGTVSTHSFHVGSEQMLIRIEAGSRILLGGISPNGTTSIPYALMTIMKVG